MLAQVECHYLYRMIASPVGFKEKFDAHLVDGVKSSWATANNAESQGVAARIAAHPSDTVAGKRSG